MANITSFARLYLALIGADARAQMQYRFAFFMRIIGLFITYFSTVATLWVLLSRFQYIQGWTLPEVIFLFVLSVTSWGFAVVFFLHFRGLGEYIRQGTFDRFLVRPLAPFLQYMALRLDLSALGQFVFSIAALIWASWNIGIHWTVGHLVFLGLSLVGGALIQAGALVLIAAVSFWTTRSETLYWVVMYPARQLTNYPISIYPGVLQWILTVLVPFGFINYYPAQILLNKPGPLFPEWVGYITPLVGAFFFAVAVVLWQIGLDRYQSTGS